MPERMLRDAIGTNGMCAGNTPAEAIIQGLCEIFERYVLRDILCDDEEPPEIPLEYVSPAIVEQYVVPLEQLGYQVYLKDCTLEGKFPVVGIFIRQSNRGLFHLGAAPDMGIALERCFTELLQGETTAGLKNALQPILPDTDAQAGQFWRREFCHAFRDYKSAQKSSMFRNTARMNKKDIFRSDDLTSVTTLNCLLQKVEDLGYDLLIRDHTFLGFPAYQLFIPGLSELQSLDSGLLAIHDRVQKARQIFFNLDKANKEDLLFLTAVIDELSSTPTVDKLEIMETIHNIPAGRNSTLYCLDYRWFASIIHFHTGNHSEAKRLLDEFIHEMESIPIDIPAYYYCMQDIFKLLLGKASWDTINSFTSSRYSEEDLLYSYFPLAKRENVARYFSIPKCVSCKDCDYADCTVKTLANYAGRFQAMIDSNMQQDAIRSFFLGVKSDASQMSTGGYK